MADNQELSNSPGASNGPGSQADLRSPWRRKCAWGVRAVLVALTVFGVFWLFVIYTPPAVRSYPGRQRVVFWHTWTAEHAKRVDRIAERFNQSQTKYEVTAVSMPGGTVKTLISTAGGDPPDCLALWDPVIPAWAERGALAPLEKIMTPEEWEGVQARLYPAVKSVGTYKGHFYGLSIGMNVFAIYYRPSMVFPEEYKAMLSLPPEEQAKKTFAFPQTLDQLDTLAKSLWTFDADGRITRIGFMPARIQDWAPIFGGALYDNKTERLTITAPRNELALEWLSSYSRQYDYSKVSNFQAGLSSTYAGSWPFMSGAFAITVDGQWRVEELKRYAKDLDYRTAPIPYPKDGGKPMAGWTYANFMVMPASARNKAGAWEFMKFWSGLENPQRAAEFYTWGGWLPITAEIADAPKYREFIKEYPQFQTFVTMVSSPNLQVLPPVAVQAYMNNRMSMAEDAARRGLVTPKQALAQLDREVQQELRLVLGAQADQQAAPQAAPQADPPAGGAQPSAAGQ